MALNPEISLGVRPPVIQPLQIQNPLEQFAKVQSLRNLMTQGQLGQLNLQQTQLENEALQDKRRRANAIAELFTGAARPSEDQILHVGGPEAAAAIKALHDADKAKFDALESTNKAITRTAQGIKALPAEQQDFAYRAERSRLIQANPALASQIPEQYQGVSWLDAKIQEGLSADQYLANVRADAKAKLEAPGIQADSLTKQAEAEQKQRQIEVSTLAPALARGAVAYQQALAGMDPKRAALYQGFATGTPRDLLMFASTPHEQIAAQQAQETAKRAAVPNTATELAVAINDPNRTPEDRDLAKRALTSLQQYELGLKTKSDQAAGGNPQLVKAVMDNPSLWGDLTPTEKGAIAAPLAAQGFIFGKPLNESAITKISETKSGIQSLQDLRTTLRENEQYIGPISGFQALNPWSDAKVAQAKINLVKQRVGKALEGGVLRKEDEEKYKQILATLNDTPSTAFAKVDNLIANLQRDLDTYIETQKAGGRRVSDVTSTRTPAAASLTVTDPRGVTHTFKTAKQAEDFKKAAGIQ